MKYLNWYKLAQMSQFSGEFWLTSDGSVMYADGDVGDYNHESYVINMIQGQYASDFDRGEYVDWEGYKNHLVTEALDSLNEIERANLQEEYDNDPTEVINKLLIEEGMSEEEIEIAEGNGDAREFAMKNWGWKRLVGLNVETWTLTPSDASSIVSGLWGAYDESVTDELEIGIYVYSTGKSYNLTVEELEKMEIKQQPVSDDIPKAQQTAFDNLDKPANPYYKDWN